ncbi:nuclear transport factor 2 family protein [Streptomyces sp. HPF1205]|uniref:nuclear transport factor 2 family protein n=1 Tax=Streptomyces sp. HPF1205 TaxID=2873262 RepID=UPI001CED7604|nr:nuclear transport factor 2 family protein [Streptomyces sp. HPF1205]
MTDTTAQPATGEAAAAGHAEQLDRYISFWNADTETEQHRLAAAVFADDVEYRALIGVLTGPQALIDFRNRFTGHMGDVALRLREQPQVHHDRARLRWEILIDNGVGDSTSFATGTDVIQLDEDGRIGSITVFLDRAPDGFTPETHH